MTFLFSFDDDYARPFAAMVTSMREHAASIQRMEVLVENFLSAGMRERLERLVSGMANCSLRWLNLDIAPIADAPVTMHFTLATYARILAFEVIRDVKRVLYLDCDMICRGDIGELWSEPLGEAVLGAVLDPNATFCADGHTEALGMKSGSIHFNAGVLLADLERWRAEDLTKRCLAFIRERREAVRWVDQDVLNATIPMWRKLSSDWNAQTHYYKPELIRLLEHYFPRDLMAAQRPKIVLSTIR